MLPYIDDKIDYITSCLQLRKSLKRKEFGIEKQLIFNKLYAEFLTLNLNWASLRNCHSNGIYKHCGKPNWTLKITLAELSKFAELNFWTEKIKRNFLLVCFSRFFFWFLSYFPHLLVKLSLLLHQLFWSFLLHFLKISHFDKNKFFYFIFIFNIKKWFFF